MTIRAWPFGTQIVWILIRGWAVKYEQWPVDANHNTPPLHMNGVGSLVQLPRSSLKYSAPSLSPLWAVESAQGAAAVPDVCLKTTRWSAFFSDVESETQKQSRFILFYSEHFSHLSSKVQKH